MQTDPVQSARPQATGSAQRSGTGWLTIQEVADRMNVSRDTVERWIRAGHVEAVDVSANPNPGRSRARWRIRVASLENFLQTRTNVPPPRKQDRPARRVRQDGIIEFIK